MGFEIIVTKVDNGRGTANLKKTTTYFPYFQIFKSIWFLNFTVEKLNTNKVVVSIKLFTYKVCHLSTKNFRKRTITFQAPQYRYVDISAFDWPFTRNTV